MTFEFCMRVLPPGIFGVPDEGKTVVPANESRQIAGPAIRSSVLVPFGHGTLSEYRKDDEALRFNLTEGEMVLRVTDNFWALVVEADTLQLAHAKAQPVINRVLHFLSVDYGVRFTYEGLFVDLSDGTTRGWPRATQVSMSDVTVYGLPKLRAEIERGFAAAHCSDPRLEKSYGYFETALQMREFAIASGVFEGKASQLWPLAFLQLWKSISVILGDPSSDRDHQSRFRNLGLPQEFWKVEVEPLYRIRNQEDVAHYNLDADVRIVAASFGEAASVAQRVLQAYVDHLRNSAPGSVSKASMSTLTTQSTDQ